MKGNLSDRIAKASHKLSEKNVNSACTWFFYVPVVPEKVKSLKKHF